MKISARVVSSLYTVAAVMLVPALALAGAEPGGQAGGVVTVPVPELVGVVGAAGAAVMAWLRR